MNVLHVLHSFPPASRGGTENYVLSIAKALAVRGDDVSVLTGSDGAPDGPPVVEGRVDEIPVFRLRPPSTERFALEARSATALESTARILAARRPDVVHVHHWHQVGTGVVGAAKSAGAAAVVSLHDFFPTCPLFFRLPDDATPCPAELPRATCVRCVGRFVGDAPEVLDAAFADRERRFRADLQAADAVLAISESTGEYYRRIPWLRGVSIDVLPLPSGGPAAVPAEGATPPPGGRPGEPRRRDPAFDLRVVSFGGLVPGKGLHTAIEAAEALENPGRIAIDHYGRALDEAYASRLRTLARRIRLRLLGAYDDAELARRLPDYDLAAFVSLFMETHGFVVDEAMAAGLPVVVSDRGAPKLRVGGRGVVVPAGDVEALREIFARFVRDPGSLERLRRGSPAPRVTLETHAAALSRVYADAIRGRRPRGG